VLQQAYEYVSVLLCKYIFHQDLKGLCSGNSQKRESILRNPVNSGTYMKQRRERKKERKKKAKAALRRMVGRNVSHRANGKQIKKSQSPKRFRFEIWVFFVFVKKIAPLAGC